MHPTKTSTPHHPAQLSVGSSTTANKITFNYASSHSHNHNQPSMAIPHSNGTLALVCSSTQRTCSLRLQARAGRTVHLYPHSSTTTQQSFKRLLLLHQLLSFVLKKVRPILSIIINKFSKYLLSLHNLFMYLISLSCHMLLFHHTYILANPIYFPAGT
jgi:hypothetical protein